MGLFNKTEKIQFDEASMHKFWEWFRDNRENDILSIVREVSLRLQRIYGIDNNSACAFGYHNNDDGGIMIFFPGDRSQAACLKRLVELAPADVKGKWSIALA